MFGQADPDVTAGELDPAGDLEEAQAKRCDGRGLELGVRQASLQLFEQSIGGDVQEQSELVGFKPLATCPVCGELTTKCWRTTPGAREKVAAMTLRTCG